MFRRLAARLPFSFLLLGGFFAFEAYHMSRGHRGPVSGGRIVLFYVLSGVFFALAIFAFRERHRPRPLDERRGFDVDLTSRRR